MKVGFEDEKDQYISLRCITKDDIDLTKPIVYGSTGTWTLIVPVMKLSRFQKMKSNNEMFPNVLVENPKSSLQPICFETHDKKTFMHARHFSSPYSGTASGVMGAYYLTYINQQLDSTEFTVEQGQEINRDGRVHVKVIKRLNSMDVFISGTAVYVKEIEIEYA